MGMIWTELWKVAVTIRSPVSRRDRALNAIPHTRATAGVQFSRFVPHRIFGSRSLFQPTSITAQAHLPPTKCQRSRHGSSQQRRCVKPNGPGAVPAARCSVEANYRTSRLLRLPSIERILAAESRPDRSSGKAQQTITQYSDIGRGRGCPRHRNGPLRVVV